MPDSSADRDQLDVLAEEFVARFRKGQRPSLTEYASRLPGREAEVRELFPALVEMEQLKPVTADQTGPFAPMVEPTDPVRVGEFRILRRVGLGGMGVVYEAVQESLGRHVALKLLPAEALADPKRLERFKREAKAAARLHHSNIVPVFGTGTADGRHFYAMQFIAGHPLDAVIDEVRRLKEKSAVGDRTTKPAAGVAAAMVTGTFAAGGDPATASFDAVSPTRERGEAPDATPRSRVGLTGDSSLSGSLSGGQSYWTTVARIGGQVADALAYAHGQGILHRDIKPANLLLDLHGVVWVTDFGLAKATDTDDLTHAGDVIGTLRYMAPERFDGQGDHRADVYALGLTLYELLTLKPAHDAENRAKLVQLVTAAAPPSPRSINPAIPRDLETVVLKAIQRDPAMRYQSSGEMADDLRRYVEDRPILARRASKAEQAWRWCRRNKAVASLIAAVLLVSLTGATVASLIARQQERTAVDLKNTLFAKEITAKQLDQSVVELREQKAKLEVEQDLSARIAYAMQTQGANAALTDGRVSRVKELLQDTTPQAGEKDYRNWEWHYLNNQLKPDRTVTYEPGTDGAREPIGILSPDGTRVILGFAVDGGLYTEVRETLTGKLVGRIPATGFFPRIHSKNGEDEYEEYTNTITSADGRGLVTKVYARNTFTERVDNQNRVHTRTRFLREKSRLWDVETGKDYPLPAELPKDSVLNPLVVGPGGRYVQWLGTPLQPDQILGPGLLEGPIDVRLHRWDRESGLTSHTVHMGRGAGSAELTRDGSTLFWRGMAIPGDDPFSSQRETGNVWFERWDLTGDRPRRTSPPVRTPTTGSVRSNLLTNYVGGGTAQDRTGLVFSPTGKKAAYFKSDKDVVVLDEKGDVTATVTFLGLPEEASGPWSRDRASQLSVSDDGNRVVLRAPDAIYVSDRTFRVTQWRIPVDDGRQRIVPNRGRLLPDGRTFVELVTDRVRSFARVWDVSPRSNRVAVDSRNLENTFGVPVTRDGKNYRRMSADDGALTLEWPESPAFTERAPRFGSNVFTGPVRVLDSAGRPLGVLPDLNAFFGPTVQRLPDVRHFLVNVSEVSPESLDGRRPLPTWRRYRLDPDGIRELDRGTGTLVPVEGFPFLWERQITNLSATFSQRNDVREIVLRHANEGNVYRRIEIPGRTLLFCGFDPTGRTCLVESYEAPIPMSRTALGFSAVIGSLTAQSFVIEGLTVPDRRPGLDPPSPTVRLHAIDVESLKERWAVEIEPERTYRMVGHARFSPDGLRIALRIGFVSPGKAPRPDRTVRDQIHVLRADGSPDSMIEVTSTQEDLVPNRLPSFGGRTAELFFSPDRRHLAVPTLGEMQIWDLETGKLVHRLAGHNRTGPNIDAVYSADGSRLFTIDPAQTSGIRETTGVPMRQIHVWDTVSGRELMTIPTGTGRPASQGGSLRRDGDTLVLSQTVEGTRTFDGSPEKK